MAFVWNSTSQGITQAGYVEIQNNVDYIADNLACVAENSTYNGTDDGSIYSGRNGSYDSGDDGAVDSGDDVSNNSGNDATDYNGRCSTYNQYDDGSIDGTNNGFIQSTYSCGTNTP